MKNLKLIITVLVIGLVMLTTQSKSQTSDTSYLTTTHVLTAQGFIISNAITNRILFMQDGDKIIEEKINSDSSYPESDGTTHVSKQSESFTSVNGTIIYYKGDFTDGDSTMVIQAEQDGNEFIVSGREEGDPDFYEWDRRKMNDIDFFVFAIDYEKQGFTKKQQVKKIYDMYSVSLRDNKMSHLGNETIELAGQTFECSIIKFDYKVIKGKMWFTKLPNGDYLLVKEEAISSEYGPFNMDLTDISFEKPSANKMKEGEFGF